jgi:hypothetical protein
MAAVFATHFVNHRGDVALEFRDDGGIYGERSGNEDHDAT